LLNVVCPAAASPATTTGEEPEEGLAPAENGEVKAMYAPSTTRAITVAMA